MICLTVQLDGTERLVLLQQSLGVFHQQRFSVADIVVVRQVYGHVPLVQMYASINCLLYLPALHQQTTKVIQGQTEHRRIKFN